MLSPNKPFMASY